MYAFIIWFKRYIDCDGLTALFLDKVISYSANIHILFSTYKICCVTIVYIRLGDVYVKNDITSIHHFDIYNKFVYILSTVYV